MPDKAPSQLAQLEMADPTALKKVLTPTFKNTLITTPHSTRILC
jgi:hypothetical protein